MKKLLYLLLLIPAALFTSCDKDELAPFDMTITLEGVTQLDGTFYAVAGQNITIQSLTATPVGGKNTALANVLFNFDGNPIFRDPWDTVGPLTFSTMGFPAGTHYIGLTGNILQVDKPIQELAATYTLVLVPSEEDLPEGAPESGSYSQTIHITK